MCPQRLAPRAPRAPRAPGALSASRAPLAALARSPSLCAALWLLALAAGCDDERRPASGEGGAGSPGGAGEPAGAGAPAGAGEPAGAGAPAGAGVPAGAGAPAGAGVPAGAEAGAEPPFAPTTDEDGAFWVRVTLDGAPLPDALVTQGGAARAWRTGDDGLALARLDPDALDALTLFASHPAARTKGASVSADRRAPLSIDLLSAALPDNPSYPFSDPGEPGRREGTAQCGHCHLANNDSWSRSPHRSSAKNPVVYDLYTGRASGLTTEQACAAAGGRWAEGQAEGRDELAWQCYRDLSALGAYNDSCAAPPCDTRALAAAPAPTPAAAAARWGGCADCHAPGVNGLAAGGHDLLTARGHAFEYGVSCDVCHHAAEVDLSRPAGAGGRLGLWRPREEASPSLGGGGYLPLSFGPSADVSNPRMGVSPRPHFRDGALCGACHQHDHADDHALNPIDRGRWPGGVISNQSTFNEWYEGPVAEVAACNECHMPPLAGLMNGGNLERFVSADVGVQGGWPRPYGEAREHAWWGPRQPDGALLRLAASLKLTLAPTTRAAEGAAGLLGAPEERLDALAAAGAAGLWRVEVETRNVGAGHGLPTGEPMRHLILQVDLRCPSPDGDTLGAPQEAVGGDVVHALAGSAGGEPRGWARVAEEGWAGARVGDVLRVVKQVAATWYPYDGYGYFGAEPPTDRWPGRPLRDDEKGLPLTLAVGSARVTAVGEGGALTLDAPLPGGPDDLVLLTRPGEAHEGYAGQSGFTFARVMLDAEGRPLSPHFVARDVARDNRLKPGQAWRSAHIFSSSCDAPLAAARLIYRPYPLWLARERGWDAPGGPLRDEVIAAEVSSAARLRALPLDLLDPLAPSLGDPPALGDAARALTLELPAPDLAARAAEREALAARGVRADEEREGEPELLSPAPPLRLALGETAALTLAHAPHAGGGARLSQPLLAQTPPLAAVEAGGSLAVALRADRAGVAAYAVERGGEVWRGVAAALPAALNPAALPLYTLTLSRAEARAATRRARPWPWRLRAEEPAPQTLNPPLAATPAPAPVPTLDLSRPLALVNLSSLPLLLDLPLGVWAWGGEETSTLQQSPAPRVTDALPPQGHALLRLPPGEGALLWASAPLAEGQVRAYGDTPQGGRAWTPPTIIAEARAPEAPLGAPEGVEPTYAAVGEALRAHLGAPVDLSAPIAAEALAAEAAGRGEGSHYGAVFLSAAAELTHPLNIYAPPPYELASPAPSALLSALSAPSAPPAPRAVIALQGGVRAGAWRLSGDLEAAAGAGRGEVVEVRNLSSGYARLWVEGAPHLLLSARGARGAARRVSWVPPRGVARLVRLGGGALRVEP